MMAQRFLRNLPLEYQLDKLNKMQEQCPFILTDPSLRPASSGQINYGFGDLYRFLGLPLSDVKIGRYTPKKPLYKPKLPPRFYDIKGNLQVNPLFHPVKYQYPIPDNQANELLSKIYMNSPVFMFHKLVELHNKMGKYHSMTGGNPGQGLAIPTNKDHNKFYINANFNDMITLVHHIMKKELDPYYLTHHLLSMDADGNRPPMQSYFRTELDALLFQLLTSNRLYNVNNKKLTDGLNISSKALDQLKGSLAEYNKSPMAIVDATYRGSNASRKKHSKRSRKSNKRGSSRRRRSSRGRSSRGRRSSRK